MPIRYLHNYFGMAYSVLVSIYEDDGTVAVSVGGIEMGQGLNTKVAQTVAKTLGISVDMVRFRPSNNLVAPNDSITGGSFGSEGCCAGALIACQELMSRIKAVKADMDKDDPTWQEAIAAAHKKGVDLTYRYL